jgi:hypothetical protein
MLLMFMTSNLVRITEIEQRRREKAQRRVEIEEMNREEEKRNGEEREMKILCRTYLLLCGNTYTLKVLKFGKFWGCRISLMMVIHVVVA